jgi:hypothetical protein
METIRSCNGDESDIRPLRIFGVLRASRPDGGITSTALDVSETDQEDRVTTDVIRMPTGFAALIRASRHVHHGESSTNACRL